MNNEQTSNLREEGEKINYIKNYYASEEHNLRELVENVDTENEDTIKGIKRDILKLQNQIETKKVMLSKIMELSYNKQYSQVSNKILLHYKSVKNNNDYYFDLITGSEEEDTENATIYELFTKVGTIRVVVGYDYELAAIITKEFDYRVSKDNDMITTKFTKETIISFMENDIVELDTNTNMITTKNEYLYNYLRPLENVKNYEFINTFYNVDYKGKLSLQKLRECNLKNKSFEIILKTSPKEIIDKLLDKTLEESLPIYKILNISQEIYNLAIERGMIEDLYNNIELIKGEKNNGIDKTEREWLDFLEEMKTYEEDLDFYNISYDRYWYSDKNNGKLSNLILSSYCSSDTLKTYYTLGKFTNYVISETINQGYTRVYEFITELTDYLNMCKLDNIKPTLYSSYLKQTHDITSRNHNIKVEREGEEIFKTRYEDFKPYNCNGYIVVAPKDTNDVKNEGDRLNHCVASYIKRIIDGQCLIYFLRKDKEESLITFEVRHNAIVQVRGLHNRKPNESEIKALTEFAKARNLEVSF